MTRTWATSKNPPTDLSGYLKLDQTTPQTTIGTFTFPQVSTTNLAVTSSVSYNLATDLYAHYLCNDTDGTDVVDNTSNHIDGTGTYTATTGKINGAIEFNGTSDGIIAPSTFTPGSTGDFSITMWIYWAGNAPAYQHLVGSQDGWYGEATYFSIWGSNAAYRGLNDGVNSKLGVGGTSFGDPLLATSNFPIIPNTWIHVGVTRTSGLLKLWINNTVVATKTGDSSYFNFSFSSSLALGLSPWDGADGYYAGKMDDIRLYNRGLSDADMSVIYNSGNGTESEGSGTAVSTANLSENTNGFLSDSKITAPYFSGDGSLLTNVPSSIVESGTNAGYAANADYANSAGSATSAGYADSAGFATSAGQAPASGGHADSADSAGYADSAGSAGYAGSADSCNYANNAGSAPANGGHADSAGYADSAGNAYGYNLSGYNNDLGNYGGWITGIDGTMVTNALGFTPYSDANPSGFISGIDGTMVTNALGFTPYSDANPAGYITGIDGTILDTVFTGNGFLKRTGTGTYTNDTGTYYKSGDSPSFVTITLSGGTGGTISTFAGANSSGRNFWMGNGGQSSYGTVGSTYQGSYNLSLGTYALYQNTTGYQNCAMGDLALYENKTGYDNVAIGRQAIWYTQSSSDTTAIGFQAGGFLSDHLTTVTATNKSVFIGSQTSPSADSNTNEIVIGFQTVGNGSNTATWGNSSITDHYFTGKIRATSFSVGATAGIDATVTYVDTLLGAKTLTFKKGILTAQA